MANKKREIKLNEKQNDMIFNDKTTHEKQACNDKLNRSMGSGMISEPTECSICNEVKECFRVHYANSDKSLGIAWLCKACHLKLHIDYRLRKDVVRHRVY